MRKALPFPLEGTVGKMEQGFKSLGGSKGAKEGKGRVSEGSWYALVYLTGFVEIKQVGETAEDRKMI